MNKSVLAVAAAALLIAGGAAGYVWWPRQAVRLAPDDAALVALGRSVYTAQCAQCHGLKLEGQPDWQTRLANGRLPAPPHDASGHTWHHPDEVLFAITKQGIAGFAPPGYESDMPAYKDVLSDREILAVLSYIKSTWPAEIRKRHDGISRQASR